MATQPTITQKFTRISKAGIELIKKYEGFEPKPYLCPAKVATTGYGTTIYPNGRKVQLTDRSITQSQATDYLMHDALAFERGVDALVRDDISQHQFDALVSFAYNLGLNALRTSTLLKKVNIKPNDPTIRNEFAKWVNAGGRRLTGLVNRRNDEANLYFT